MNGGYPGWQLSRRSVLALACASGLGSPAISRTQASVSEFKPVHGVVYAVDATDGTERWRAETASMTGQPVVTTDAVYTISHEAVRVLDRESGETEWELDDGTADVWRHINQQLQPRITVNNGLVYINTGTLYALTPDGSIEWEYDLADNLSVTPTVTEELVIACRNDIRDQDSGQYELIALDSETGTVAWSVERKSELETQPLVTDGVVYVEKTDEVYDLDTGEKREMDAPTTEGTDTADTSQSNPNVPEITIREPDTNTAETGSIIEAYEDEKEVWSFDTSDIKQIDYGDAEGVSQWWIVHEPVVDEDTVFIGCIQWDEIHPSPPELPEDTEEGATNSSTNDSDASSDATNTTANNSTDTVTNDETPLRVGPTLAGIVGLGVLGRLLSDDE